MMSLKLKEEQREEGFTLIELLVVVIIIGILAAIAIPVFLNQRQSAWESSVESDLRNAAMQLETLYTQEGDYENAVVTDETDSFTIGDDDQIEVLLSNGVTVSITTSNNHQEFVITGEHDNFDDTLQYDSADGGLQDWDRSGGGN